MVQPPSMHVGITQGVWTQFRRSWLDLTPQGSFPEILSVVNLLVWSDPQRTERRRAVSGLSRKLVWFPFCSCGAKMMKMSC